MIIVSFDKCMCARIPLPAMKVKISRRGGPVVQRAGAGNITANTNKHFSNQNQIKWQNALNLNPVCVNISIAGCSCSVWTLYNAMTRLVPGAGSRAVRCVAAAAPRGRFRASPSPPPVPATRGHTTFLAGQHGSLAAGSTGVSLPFFGPPALVFFLMSPILNLFHKFLPSYIYWAQSWVRTGFKFIGQEIKLIFNTGIGLQQEFHINNVRISEEFHLRLTSPSLFP